MSDISGTKDIELLIEAMQGLGGGSFATLDESEFSDPRLAVAFNNMVDQIVERNNHYLARINDAQSRIGDTSCLKSMFEEITAQEDVLRVLQETEISGEEGKRPLNDINDEFLTMAEQLKSGFEPCRATVAGAVRKLDELLEKDEIKAQDDVREALSELRGEFNYPERRLEGIYRRINAMNGDARELYEIIDSKIKLNKTLLEGVDTLTNSYKKLSGECLDTGRHLYRISRDIDNARNDMFRHNSLPNLHDRLRVYEVDHITLAWRLYNNIVEFESLRATQVNNPNTCKFGIWVANMEDEFFLGAESFQKSARAHENLHKACVECFEAKQAYDTRLAMEKFNDVMDRLGDFRTALEELHEYLRANGITAETDVWKFRV